MHGRAILLASLVILGGAYPQGQMLHRHGGGAGGYSNWGGGWGGWQGDNWGGWGYFTGRR
jgi:hypothetical protein